MIHTVEVERDEQSLNDPERAVENIWKVFLVAIPTSFSC